MSDNGQGTTTQGQSIPTAEFDKMFGKDKGMPGQDELLSTMQDRSELSASEARWNRCVTPQIAQVARVDVTLHAVLQLWRQDMSRSFQMVATEYLKTGASLAEMASKVGISADLWGRAWPKWPAARIPITASLKRGASISTRRRRLNSRAGSASMCGA